MGINDDDRGAIVREDSWYAPLIPCIVLLIQYLTLSQSFMEVNIPSYRIGVVFHAGPL